MSYLGNIIDAVRGRDVVAPVAARVEELETQIKGMETMVPDNINGLTTNPFADRFHKIRIPAPAQMLDHFRETVYSCASINATAIASVPWRLYVETRQGQPRAKCRTKPLTKQAKSHLAKQSGLARRLTKAVHVEEIEDHPLITLLEKANPFMERFKLFELLDIYLELNGRSYWRLERAGNGILSGLPLQIWPLPAHRVEVKQDNMGPESDGEIYYEYFNGRERIQYAKDEVVAFSMPDPRNPYTGGYSPLMGIIESALTGANSRAHALAILENKARPDAIISPKSEDGGDDMMDSDTRERFEERLNLKFRRAGNGSIAVSGTPLDITPLTFTAKELESIKLEMLTDQRVANAFGVPISMLKTESSNRAVADAGLYQHARHAVLPRCMRIQDVINEVLCPLYSDRIFFAFDNPVPDDEELKQKLANERVDRSMITVNEWRAEEGMEPVPWGDEPVKASAPAPAEPKEDDDKKENPEEKKTVNNSESLGQLVNIINAQSWGEITRSEARTRIERLGYAASKAAHWTEPFALPVDDEHDHQESSRRVTSKQWVDEGDDGGHARRMPKGSKMRRELVKFFERQRMTLLRSVKAFTGARLKDEVPAADVDWSKPIDLSAWNEDLAQRVRPSMGDEWEKGWLETASRLDLDAAFDVTSPMVDRALTEAAFAFADSTNRTTSKDIELALEDLRDTLAEGILRGPNTVAELTKRVNAVFHNAETWRAARIAITESARAVHAGQDIAAKESGIVSGYEWLLSDNACPICLGIKASVPKVKLGQSFATRGTGPYSDIPYPPAHPNCQCTIVEIIDEAALV